MFSSASAVYSLKRPARCIAGQTPAADCEDQETPGFLVGTCSLREENELHLLGFHEDNNELLCEKIFSHPDEIWGISPSPRDQSLVLTCGNACRTQPEATEGAFKVALWKLPDECPVEEEEDDPRNYSNDTGELGPMKLPLGDPLASVGSFETATTAMLWSPTSNQRDALVTLGDGRLTHWDFSSEGFSEVGTASVCREPPAAASRLTPAAAWDPHRPDQVVTAVGCSMVCWDLRSMSPSTTVANAHRYAVCDVDYNPNKPFCAVTGGEDRLIKFWDLRKPKSPVMVMLGHDHWVCTVKYNRFHDQLLLSGSSDCMVHLWRVSSVSSAPLLEPDDDHGLEPEDDLGEDLGSIERMGKGEAADIRVRTFDEHEDTVTAVVWSECDAWVMASLSYDGRVILNHVPSAEKYKILL
ncbi:unnamed protein product [Discosporangium mesarthrocarpum]